MVLVDEALPAGKDVVVNGDRAHKDELPGRGRDQQGDRADKVALQVQIEVQLLANGLPVHAVMDHAVSPFQQVRPDRCIRLVAHDESVHDRLDVLPAARGADKAGHRMSRLAQMPGKNRADKPRNAGYSNSHQVHRRAPGRL